MKVRLIGGPSDGMRVDIPEWMDAIVTSNTTGRTRDGRTVMSIIRYHQNELDPTVFDYLGPRTIVFNHNEGKVNP